jgi:hypothetical protein
MLGVWGCVEVVYTECVIVSSIVTYPTLVEEVSGSYWLAAKMAAFPRKQEKRKMPLALHPSGAIHLTRQYIIYYVKRVFTDLDYFYLQHVKSSPLPLS